MTLTEAGMKMELVKGEHMALLVRILCNFPIEAMQGLNLSNNNLRNLQQMVPLLKKVPNLKELILTGNNMIRSWDDLKYVQEWKLLKLDITECQLNKMVGGKTAIKQSKEARKVFKSLKTFNGKELSVSFDLGDSIDTPADAPPLIPLKRDSLLPDLPGLEGPLIGFIQKFITAFDTNRESLMYCYASDAVFTLCVGRGTDMSEYRKHQRNLINYRFHMDGPNAEKYRSCHPNTIKKKKLLIVATMEEMPKTEHDLLNSCFLDVTLQAPTIIGFSLTGTFIETESRKVRFFSRHILCKINMADQSFVISNDQMFVRDATHTESSNHGKKPKVAPQPSKSSPEVIVADANSQAESIKKFMHESGMIDSYSRMCLEQNDWNYNKAGEKFLEMKAKGIIPADAWQPGRAL